jgi:hypothetical protein
MFSDIEDLDQLAESVRQGETGAAARLREAMGPALQRILRRAARSGPEQTTLDRRLLAAARVDPSVEESGQAADRAAYRLCSAVVERIADGRMTRPMMIRETVLA